MPAATTRRGDLPLGQLVSDLDQDRSQRLCISIRSALVLPRLLCIAELDAARLGGGERLLGSDRDVPALLLGQRRVDVQQERINFRPQFGDDERDTARHQARDEGNVAAQSVQLGNHDRALAPLGPSANAAAS
jgi:hypothetical protein